MGVVAYLRGIRSVCTQGLARSERGGKDNEVIAIKCLMPYTCNAHTHAHTRESAHAHSLTHSRTPHHTRICKRLEHINIGAIAAIEGEGE
jgi:hypothetical protein